MHRRLPAAVVLSVTLVLGAGSAAEASVPGAVKSKVTHSVRVMDRINSNRLPSLVLGLRAFGTAIGATCDVPIARDRLSGIIAQLAAPIRTDILAAEREDKTLYPLTRALRGADKRRLTVDLDRIGRAYDGVLVEVKDVRTVASEVSAGDCILAQSLAALTARRVQHDSDTLIFGENKLTEDFG